MELALDVIQRTGGGLVADCGANRISASNPLQTHLLHEPLNRTAGDRKALPAKLPPDFTNTINLKVLGKDAENLRLEGCIPLRSQRLLGRIKTFRGMSVIGGWGNRQIQSHTSDDLIGRSFPCQNAVNISSKTIIPKEFALAATSTPHEFLGFSICRTTSVGMPIVILFHFSRYRAGWATNLPGNLGE